MERKYKDGSFLRPENRSKTSKNVSVIAASNEYSFKIQVKDVSIRPLSGF